MWRFELGVCLALLSLATVWPLAAAAAELPTAEEVLKTFQQNKERLSQLHVQTVHTYEQGAHTFHVTREKAGKSSRSEPEWPDDEVVETGRTSDGQILETHKIKPMHFIEPMEFFVDGQRYQRRQPVQAERSDAELNAWRFPNEPVTTESLPIAYRGLNIFSRSPKANPIVRVWDGDRTAYVSQEHLDDSMMHGPPLIDVGHLEWGEVHPIDAFFSRPAKRYHVLGQEIVDGRLLTLVELRFPPADPGPAAAQQPEAQPAKTTPDADKIQPAAKAYRAVEGPPTGSRIGSRAWIDLARGALPMRIETPQTYDTMVVQRVIELPNGAFYPAKTLLEKPELDRAAGPLTNEQWAEIQAGKRKPPLVVKDRITWDASLVELKTDFADDFFAFAFPERQEVWDSDTNKMVGALEKKPLVKVGQPAPPLSISRWVDGKERTLESLRGQVVVLHFGFHTGRTGSSGLQERFAGKPVVFIALYGAVQDPAALAARIESVQKKNKSHYIAAIDAGWMLQNSATRCGYGVGICPQTVIIGRDGKIAYADPVLDGPRCDEEDEKIVNAWKAKVDQYHEERFKAVGASWPLATGLSDREESDACRRVNGLYYAKQIEAALGAKD